MKKVLLAAAFCAATTVAGSAADLVSRKAPPAPVAAAPFGFLFEDTQIYFDYKPFGKEPGVSNGPPNQSQGANTPKYIFGLTHFDVWQYGTNFFNVELLQSTRHDPPAPSTPFYLPGAVGTGATEVYGLYRGTISGNSVTGSKMFAIGGIVKDLSFGFGVDANTKNTSFASEKKFVVAGPRIDFDVPGVLGVQFNVAHEWNYNGIVQKSVSFRVGAEIEIVYAQPLTFTGLPLSLAGFTNFVFPKGRDGFGNYTKTEINSETKLVLDVGQVVGGRKGLVDLFVGYKYWLNKFGNDSQLRNGTYPFQLSSPGSVESTVFAGIAWHVF